MKKKNLDKVSTILFFSFILVVSAMIVAYFISPFISTGHNATICNIVIINVNFTLNAAQLLIYQYVLIILAILIVLAIVIIGLYYCIKLRNKKKILNNSELMEEENIEEFLITSYEYELDTEKPFDDKKAKTENNKNQDDEVDYDTKQ